MENKPVKMGSRIAEPTALILESLAAEDDRGCVLVGCARIEYSLEQLLREYMLDCVPTNTGIEKLQNKVFRGSEEGPGILGSGYARATIAYLLGLIEERTYKLYNFIRWLRQDCAHHPGQVELSDSSIKNLLELFLEDAFGKEHLQETENYNIFGLRQKAGEFSLARRQFMTICMTVDCQIQRTLRQVGWRRFKQDDISIVVSGPGWGLTR